MRKTREMPAEIVLSGHGDPIVDHVALIDDRLAKHERRKEKIYELIAEQPRSGYEIAQAIWGNVAVTQAFLTLSEVIGHADLLVNEGRVREGDDGKVVRYEAARNTAGGEGSESAVASAPTAVMPETRSASPAEHEALHRLIAAIDPGRRPPTECQPKSAPES